jgi:hypothetical protein
VGSKMIWRFELSYPMRIFLPAVAAAAGSYCFQSLLRLFQRSFLWPEEQKTRKLGHVLESVAAVAAAIGLVASVAAPWVPATETAPLSQEIGKASEEDRERTSGHSATERETVVSGYAGAPWYYRSDVNLSRHDGTDLQLKRLGWDGDALYFPIDGGARVIRWSGSFGTMIDFVHNKAVARLGRGAHGRQIENGVVETVETSGRLRGELAPETLRLTDLFERLEFTHGHNVVFFTGMIRTLPLAPALRPYFGIGAGVAIPHVEIGFIDGPSRQRTNEYQVAGPAAQLVAGIEFRHGRGSYFLEYKFIWTSISATLSGDRSYSFKHIESLKFLPKWFLEPFSGLMEMPGDLFRQFRRWMTKTKVDGWLWTRLYAHQLVAGAGYVRQSSSLPTP